MLLLALDTAGPAVSVALHDGHDVVATASGVGTMAHGELLAPAIRDVLAEAGVTAADLTDVAVGVGPGPYTGLRVGVVTALTLAQTLGLTTHGVCSLDALAVGTTGEVLVAIDARRKEVYWARYVDARRVDGPHVDRPATLAERHPGLPVVGRGAALYPDLLVDGGGPLDAEAADLARAVVAGTVEELPLEPLYLRRPDAVEPGAVKRA
ncbi:tRNA threonylcarbamoyladenosine biosynthesis protein TsaB [Aeromicrobium sp. Root495]|uniref:tRNA (adenosine(37)-N6)-threonylcarbamoyltransferase complex dimerization subunit type 1 TsaB n=1 Tax=Aeromicrobium sp. Root495 TaxID=1736550 RepID=UPI0006F642F7|nr:tRNA (adenosine(37)-N6)-threonylcarbamoyltransferase complex dimerization subunit type 1 TsaB [Aeromicrobium sp. Root495]KQY60056.1 tRNA threonylcarbamoyladenosine biosynthesis protein TsaB [Aeromicrobium sp. Root495]RYJ07402.1 MAG: tRNA (adenosine(37)-N6)-threonylcarbamoyltransferase complex dimerization subunit type 1 TsaB [Actinomycetales bacterium]